MTGRPRIPLEDRFWPKVHKTESCWIWMGTRNEQGYGHMKLRRGVNEAYTAMAHRVSVELHGRTIPPGMQVDHLCRNRRCVNPAHLDIVTPAENTRRSAGNASKTHCKYGHAFAGTNLFIDRNGTHRRCRICMRAEAHKYRDHRVEYCRRWRQSFTDAGLCQRCRDPLERERAEKGRKHCSSCAALISARQMERWNRKKERQLQ